jgi:Putative Actinobacterial Holin-X, holin superfamily III
MIKLSRNSSSISFAQASTAGIGKAGLIASWKRLLLDSLSLAGLQAQLFSIDGKAWLGRVHVAIILLIASIVLGLASLPLLLAAAVVGLTVIGIHVGWALLLVGGVGILVAALVASMSVRRITESSTSFDRSRQEFGRNMSWMREQLTETDGI